MKKWRATIIILMIGLTGFFLSLFGLMDYPKNLFWKGIQPVGVAIKFSFGQIPALFKNVFHLKTIVQQNKNLVEENLNLQSKLAKLSEAEYENEILKKELGFAREQISSRIIAAPIIGRSPGYLKNLTINKGLKDGVKKGQAVISQGFLIGILNQVRQDTADVTLITDFNSLVPAVLQNSRGTGLLRGGLRGLTVESIPLNIAIHEEENVVTSGLGGQIPSGIIIGKVKGIISKEGEIFQKVSVVSPVDFSRLEVVFVVNIND